MIVWIMEHRKTSQNCWNNKIIAVSMATMTFQYGGYISFKLM